MSSFLFKKKIAMSVIIDIAIFLEECDDFLSIRGKSCFVDTACEWYRINLEVLIAEIVASGII